GDASKIDVTRSAERRLGWRCVENRRNSVRRAAVGMELRRKRSNSVCRVRSLYDTYKPTKVTNHASSDPQQQNSEFPTNPLVSRFSLKSVGSSILLNRQTR